MQKKKKNEILTIDIPPPTLVFHKRRDQIINSLFSFVIDRFHAVSDRKIPEMCI